MDVKFKFFLILFGLGLVMACKKNKEPLPPTNGIYRGVFSKIFEEDGDTIGTGVVFLALYEEGCTFSLQGDTSSNAPFSCNGDYRLMGQDSIAFYNKAFITEAIEDPHYVLDTTYIYEFLDTSFFIQYRQDGFLYDYNLARF